MVWLGGSGMSCRLVLNTACWKSCSSRGVVIRQFYFCQILYVAQCCPMQLRILVGHVLASQCGSAADCVTSDAVPYTGRLWLIRCSPMYWSVTACHAQNRKLIAGISRRLVQYLLRSGLSSGSFGTAETLRSALPACVSIGCHAFTCMLHPLLLWVKVLSRCVCIVSLTNFRGVRRAAKPKSKEKVVGKGGKDNFFASGKKLSNGEVKIVFYLTIPGNCLIPEGKNEGFFDPPTTIFSHP